MKILFKFFKDKEGEIQEIYLDGVEPTDTIGDMKLRLSEIHDLPGVIFHAENIRLAPGGRNTENSRMLQDYYIHLNPTIITLVRDNKIDLRY